MLNPCDHQGWHLKPLFLLDLWDQNGFHLPSKGLGLKITQINLWVATTTSRCTVINSATWKKWTLRPEAIYRTQGLVALFLPFRTSCITQRQRCTRPPFPGPKTPSTCTAQLMEKIRWSLTSWYGEYQNIPVFYMVSAPSHPRWWWVSRISGCHQQKNLLTFRGSTWHDELTQHELHGFSAIKCYTYYQVGYKWNSTLGCFQK